MHAAALSLREAFLQVSGFDEDFFSYMEDVDLGFRLRLHGHCCLYVPGAIVYHLGSASLGAKSDFALYHFHRNLVWMFVQNMPPSQFWLHLPAHILANLIYPIYLTMCGRGRVISRAKWDALCGRPRALRKRREIQNCRTAGLTDLAQVMQKSLFQPYLIDYYGKKTGIGGGLV